MSGQKGINTSYPRGDRSRESHDRKMAAVKSDGKRPVASVHGRNITENHLEMRRSERRGKISKRLRARSRRKPYQARSIG